jgi:hypothetical protein
MILERMRIDALVGIENRGGVFPIHRGLRFLLVSATSGRATAIVPARLGIRDPATLEQLPGSGPDPHAVGLSRELLERLSGPALAIPELRSARDLVTVRDIAFGSPALGDPDGWNVRFGRELNATEDRRHFSTSGRGLPVLEGKQIRPFGIDLGAVRFHIARQTAATLLDPERTFRRRRLAYRDVASAANRLTLIAAIVPKNVVTTHTLFCLKNALDDESQEFLCGVLNSYVANYLVRLRVNTHVSATILDRLPVPRPSRSSRTFVEIVALSRRLGAGSVDLAAHARLQGHVGRLYGLDVPRFERILETLPLVPRAERDGAMTAFCDIVS